MQIKEIAIIGGGPAGLAAAEILSLSGHTITVYDSMPTLSRKFLLAGKSGLNLTHAEDYTQFVTRFGAASERLRPALDGFEPDAVRAWAEELGIQTFVGSSRRVFPKAMKASPLLRAWLKRLESRGVNVRTRHRWVGFSGTAYLFDTPDGQIKAQPDVAMLALGGASWPRLGSDANWTVWLQDAGVNVSVLQPANCGFDVAWDEVFRDRFAGQPVKAVTATSNAGTIPGEFVITWHGIEGSLVYAHAASLREELAATGKASLLVDLAPGRSLQRLVSDLTRQNTKTSFSNRLRKAAGIDGVKLALLRNFSADTDLASPEKIATSIKNLSIPVVSTRPIAEAISSAGGVEWDSIDENYMLKAIPGLFVAGEMLDWEAPTGGYLLTACFATGRAAAHGIISWLTRSHLQ
ncbi:TIGR03862 family flavoprotein [Phyllobacterium sp. YR531]|uniref:TIGR03862 family flavoprotein n=1 Tax=Phyllobacterium sp. YR531 TaxID=1144343 RepID=UPI000A310CAB|nr:TIGR03862 family flavoprotein [Phyllobacterium sp. YR531]